MTSENLTSTDTSPTDQQSSKSSQTQDQLLTTNSNDFNNPLSALLVQFPRGFSTVEEGQAFVKRLQQLRKVPTTLKAELQKESDELEQKMPRRTKKTSQTKVDGLLEGLL